MENFVCHPPPPPLVFYVFSYKKFCFLPVLIFSSPGQPKPEEVERRVYLYKDTMEWRIAENDHTKAAAICEKHGPAGKLVTLYHFIIL